MLFTIPLRRALIVEAKLKFPEGIATAEVLKSGERGGSDIKYIVQAAVAGGLFKFGAAGLQIWTEVIEAARAKTTELVVCDVRKIQLSKFATETVVMPYESNLL